MAVNTSLTSNPTGAQPNAPGATNPAQKIGTGYVNLQNYVNANNPTQLGNTIANNVSNSANNAVKNLNTSQTQYNTQAGQVQNALMGQQTNAQNALNQIINAPSTTTYSTDANGNPVQSLTSPTGASQYNNYLNATYQGPSSLSNTTQLQNQATNAQQQANLLGSQGGQQQLLRSFVNQPGYNYNLQNLDSVLLGSNQGVQNQLQGAKTQALQKLSANNVNNVNNVDAQQAALAAQGLQTNQQALNTQGQNATTGINNAINTQLQNLENTSNTNQNNYNAIASGQYAGTGLSAAQQAALTAAQNNKFTSLNNLVNYNGPTDLTASGAATNPQAAQLAALSQLQGTGAQALSGNIGDAAAAQLNTSGILPSVQNLENTALAQSGSNLYNQFNNQSGLGTAGQAALQALYAPSQASQGTGGGDNINGSTGGALSNSNPLFGNTLTSASQYLNSLPANNGYVQSGVAPDVTQLLAAINGYYGLSGAAPQASNTITSNGNTIGLK